MINIPTVLLCTVWAISVHLLFDSHLSRKWSMKTFDTRSVLTYCSFNIKALNAARLCCSLFFFTMSFYSNTSRKEGHVYKQLLTRPPQKKLSFHQLKLFVLTPEDTRYPDVKFTFIWEIRNKAAGKRSRSSSRLNVNLSCGLTRFSLWRSVLRLQQTLRQ